MGKTVLIFITFCCFCFRSSSKVVICLKLTYKNEVNHSVLMYFAEDNIDSVRSKLSKIDSLNERNVLKSFGRPLVDFKLSEGNCLLLDTVVINYLKLFKNKSAKTLRINTRRYMITLKLVKADYQECVFRATSKYWTSYDFDFGDVSVITTSPIISQFSNFDLSEIDALCNTLVAK